MSDFNARIIDEFRATGGKLFGGFEGTPMVLLTTTGAKSGTRRTNAAGRISPMATGSSSSRPRPERQTNPDWYHNLKAHPEVTVGGWRRHPGAQGRRGSPVEERDRLFRRTGPVTAPGFADYQAKTTRQIPVIALVER